MTYARARLWLGITGVGSLVTLAAITLSIGLPHNTLSTATSFGASEFLQLSVLTGSFLLWLLPLDLLGGFILPRQYGKSDQSFAQWFRGYSVAAFSQAILFTIFGSLIVTFSQRFGIAGGAIAIVGAIAACFFVRNWSLLNRAVRYPGSGEKLLDAITMIQSWDTFVPRTVVVPHKDIGFTGGIVGLGKKSQIVIPEAWLSFPREQLATAIARRAVAINSGSYSRGLAMAFAWNFGGFLLCTLLPGGGLTSIAGLATTVCGFTIWSFLGLLVLPTISRNASLAIDQHLARRGMPADLISSAALTMDSLQDGEPRRPRLIETIFHPVPNVASRNCKTPVRGLTAWNVARTSLFFSWACLGFLSRSVHCNVGRPELWTMLPTD